MSEWWTYRPADLLMFAPRTYWRLFELQNQALWPMPVLTTLVFLAVGLGLLRRNDTALRAGTAALALCWALVAWSFHLQRYAPINPVATVSAGVFAVQALGLLALAGTGGLRTTVHLLRCEIGLGLLAWALLLYPLHALVAGRLLVQAEVFGFAPDPTAIGSLGLLWVLISAGMGEQAFAATQACLVSPLGRLALAAYSAALMYHLFNGIRHLMWDAGMGFELPEVYRSGYTVITLAVVLTGTDLYRDIAEDASAQRSLELADRLVGMG